MASELQSAPQSIPEVLSTIEQRQFWERVYIAAIERSNDAGHTTEIADYALGKWRERFGPKVAE